MKEAIEFLKKQDYIWIERLPHREIDKYIAKLNEAIRIIETQLQQGKKCRLMWEKCKRHHSYDGYVEKIMNDFEQKYLPKPKEKVIK